MSQREFVTDVLSESQRADVLSAVVGFLVSKGVERVRTEFGFVVQRDLHGEKQGEDAIVPVRELPRFIEDGLREGTIEWGGSSDFRCFPVNLDFQMLFCNDTDLHFSAQDSALLMALSRLFFALGVRVYEDGSLIAME